MNKKIYKKKHFNKLIIKLHVLDNMKPNKNIKHSRSFILRLPKINC